MGSWACSLHVRSQSADAVVKLIRAIASERGLREVPRSAVQAVGAAPDALGTGRQNDDRLDDELDDDNENETQNYVIGQSRDGWVAVLTDFLAVQDITKSLANRLGTDALAVFVNDSDSWLYLLCHDGAVSDEFDSSGETEPGEADPAVGDPDAQMPADLAEAMERGDEEEIARLSEKYMQLQQPMNMASATGPMAEIGRLQQLKNAGQLGFFGRLKLRWLWLKFLIGMVTGRGARFGFDLPPRKPLTPEDLDRHIAKLREVFPNLDEAKLREVLPQNRFPAEELLGEFLVAIGWPKELRLLSYDYLEEFSETELRTAGVVEVARLQFSPQTAA